MRRKRFSFASLRRAAHRWRWMTMRSACVSVIALTLMSASSPVSAAEGWIPFKIYFPDPPQCQLRTSAAKAITTLREWHAFWQDAQSYQSEDLSENCEIHALPRVDFGKYTLLVLALGQRPSGGYSAVFQYAYENSSRIDVAALEVRPNGKDCTATTSFTYPVTFALIPRTKKPVQIHVDYADLQCGEAHGTWARSADWTTGSSTVSLRSRGAGVAKSPSRCVE